MILACSITEVSAFSRRRPAASTPKPAFLLDPCADRPDRQARVLRVLLELGVDVRLADPDVVAPGDLVERDAPTPPRRWPARAGLRGTPPSRYWSCADRSADPSGGARSPRRGDRPRGRRATPGTGNGTRAASFFSTSLRICRSPASRASASRSCRTRSRSAVERVELAEVLRELVVERRARRACGCRARSRCRRLRCPPAPAPRSRRDSAAGTTWSSPALEPGELGVESGRVRRRADLDGHAFVLFLLAGLAVLVERLALEIDDERVAIVGGAALDRLEARRAFAQPLERLVDGFVFDVDRRPPHFDRRELAGIERAARRRTRP